MTTPKLRARYLTANAAWVLTFGDQIIPVGADRGRRFFPTREALREALDEVGVILDRDGTIRDAVVVEPLMQTGR